LITTTGLKSINTTILSIILLLIDRKTRANGWCLPSDPPLHGDAGRRVLFPKTNMI